MKRIGKKLFPVLLLLLSFGAGAQLELPEDKVSWKFTVEQNGDEATIIGTIKMVEHWHIYAANLPDGVFTLPTEFKLTAGPEFKAIGGVIEPKPIFEHDEMADEDLYYHSGTIKIKRKIKVLSEKDFKLKGTFTFQTCDDSHCLPPHTAKFTVDVKGVKGDEASTNIEDSFVTKNGDEAKDKDGVNYVNVNNEWHAVPEGNSNAFYKKYLTLGGE